MIFTLVKNEFLKEKRKLLLIMMLLVPIGISVLLAFDLLIFIVKSFRDKLSNSGISVFIVARVLLKKASSLFTNRISTSCNKPLSWLHCLFLFYSFTYFTFCLWRGVIHQLIKNISFVWHFYQPFHFLKLHLSISKYTIILVKTIPIRLARTTRS